MKITQAQIYTAIKLHGVWIAPALLGLLLLVSGASPSDYLKKTAFEKQAKLDQTKIETLGKLDQIRNDAATAENLGGPFDHDRITRALQPTDKKAAILRMETLAMAARFSGFIVDLSEEKPLPNGIQTPDTTSIKQTHIHIKAKAPHDLDVERFFTRLTQVLPGKIKIETLSMKRLDEDKTVQDTNLSLEASLLWTANASTEGEN